MRRLDSSVSVIKSNPLLLIVEDKHLGTPSLKGIVIIRCLEQVSIRERAIDMKFIRVRHECKHRCLKLCYWSASHGIPYHELAVLLQAFITRRE